jgi:O-methyltransferase
MNRRDSPAGRSLVKRLITKGFGLAGYRLVPHSEPVSPRERNPDITDAEWATYLAVEPYTMTTLERVLAAIRASVHVSENKIPGDIVECGVWRGGSSMAIARTLQELGDTSRTLYLFDTFEGMNEPTVDDMDHHGEAASSRLATMPKGEGNIWARASIEDVRSNLGTTGYPSERMIYVKGPVEQTIPGTSPQAIALLRLDTDWYESTRHELIHLYPRLSPGGVLIIDDYGHWQGARKAVDEYFGGRQFLSRIDYTGRLAIKPGGTRVGLPQS